MVLRERLCAEAEGEFVVELHDKKNGESPNVPIHPRIVSITRKLSIKIKRDAEQKHFRETRDAAGMPDLHLHD